MNKIDFEQTLARLEAINERMSCEDTPLAETVELYREAAELAKQLEICLTQAKNEIQEITESYEKDNEL